MYRQAPAFLLSLLYGLSMVISKQVLVYAPPLCMTALRTLIPGLVLWGYAAIKGKQSNPVEQLSKSAMLYLLAGALIGVYGGMALETWGLQFVDVPKASLIKGSTPILTAIFSYFLFAEKMTILQWLGLFLGLFGCSIIFLDSSIFGGGTLFLTQFIPNSWDEWALFGSAVCGALYGIILRILIKEKGVAPFFVNWVMLVLSGFFALVHSLAVEEWSFFSTVPLAPFMGWFLVLIVLGGFICPLLNAQLLRYHTPTHIAFVGSTQPFFAAFFAWLLLGEVASKKFWLSFFMILAGLYLYLRKRRDDTEIKALV